METYLRRSDIEIIHRDIKQGGFNSHLHEEALRDRDAPQSNVNKNGDPQNFCHNANAKISLRT